MDTDQGADIERRQARRLDMAGRRAHQETRGLRKDHRGAGRKV